MINIIFAPPRFGKTSYMTAQLCDYAFDFDRYCCMRNEINFMNLSGFKLSVPNNPCSANYNIKFTKFGYLERRNRVINPYRLGFKNSTVNTHFNYPYEVIGITEGQKYLNSRMSRYFPRWQSSWYEQHGHDSLDIFIDTQRPMLIDANIRELSSFTEIINLEKHYNDFGCIKGLTWCLRDIPHSSAFDRYIASGKKDKSCYSERIYSIDYNIFDCYDSQSCKPKFYDGHFNSDFDVNLSSEVDISVDGYLKFLEKYDDELPPGFYIK